MRYMRIATYDMVKGTFPELTATAERGILPMFAQQPGFMDYGLVDIGANKFVSISIWQTRDAAHESANIAAAWVKDNSADRVRLMNSYVGELALFHGAPVTV